MSRKSGFVKVSKDELFDILCVASDAMADAMCEAKRFARSQLVKDVAMIYMKKYRRAQKVMKWWVKSCPVKLKVDKDGYIIME